MVAPMAIALRAQGVPIKIVYLGHRYGSAVVVQKDGPIHSVKDLRGRIIAIPSRFSDERLIVFKALKQNGMTGSDVKMIEMAPPDVAGALAAGAVDAFSMGEPYPSQAELGGFGRVLFHAREYWPDYMSCVVVVRQDVIDKRPHAVQIQLPPHFSIVLALLNAALAHQSRGGGTPFDAPAITSSMTNVAIAGNTITISVLRMAQASVAVPILGYRLK